MMKHKLELVAGLLSLVLITENNVNVLAFASENQVVETEEICNQENVEECIYEEVTTNDEEPENQADSLELSYNDQTLGESEDIDEDESAASGDSTRITLSDDYLYNKQVYIGWCEAAVIHKGRLYVWGKDGSGNIKYIPERVNKSEKYQRTRNCIDSTVRSMPGMKPFWMSLSR